MLTCFATTILIIMNNYAKLNVVYKTTKDKLVLKKHQIKAQK